jgi:hypothetical protein
MDGVITMPDGTTITVTGTQWSEVDGVRRGSGGISTAAGGYARQHQRETGRLTLADGRQATVTIDGVHIRTRTGMPIITTLHFTLPEDWTS